MTNIQDLMGNFDLTNTLCSYQSVALKPLAENRIYREIYDQNVYFNVIVRIWTHSGTQLMKTGITGTEDDKEETRLILIYYYLWVAHF